MAKIDLGRVVGADGKSAYQIAVEHGFEGTEQEWIDSLNYDDDISALDEKINQEIEDRTNADNEIKDLITTTVDLAIANVVNDAPEDFDTLKEMSDWISEHSEDASAMNSAILENKNAILENKNAIAKKADASHSHDDRYYTETEIDTKLNSPLPWKFNYLETGYSKDLQYRKIGEGYITYNDNMNWSFYSEIEMIHHNSSSVFERGTIFVNLRGHGSSINTNRVGFHSLSGGITNLSKTKINYKIDTTNKRIYLEILAYCYSNYTNILFRNSLTRNSDMLFFDANNFWTFAANGSYKQSATTMQAGVTSGYTEIPLSVVSIDKNGNDIVNTYATKTELSGKADISHTHSEYHNKTIHNVKNYGTPSGTTRYVEVSASEHFAGVEVNVAYSGKWYFSNPGSEPLYLGYNGATYNNYGLTGWAWSSENKKLYLRFAGWRGVSVSCLGATANMVNINDWTTTAPSGITFQTGEYDIKAEIDNLASANAGMSVSAKNVMEATGSIDFNTNKAILQLPIYSAEDTDQPTALGAMWIQEIKEDEE